MTDLENTKTELEQNNQSSSTLKDENLQLHQQVTSMQEISRAMSEAT